MKKKTKDKKRNIISHNQMCLWKFKVGNISKFCFSSLYKFLLLSVPEHLLSFTLSEEEFHLQIPESLPNILQSFHVFLFQFHVKRFQILFDSVLVHGFGKNWIPVVDPPSKQYLNVTRIVKKSSNFLSKTCHLTNENHLFYISLKHFHASNFHFMN